MLTRTEWRPAKYRRLSIIATVFAERDRLLAKKVLLRGGDRKHLTCVHHHARISSGKLKSGIRLLAATNTRVVNSPMSW